MTDVIITRRDQLITRRDQLITRRDPATTLRASLALFLADDVVAQLNAGCADVDIFGTFDHGAGIALALAAKTAATAFAFLAAASG